MKIKNKILLRVIGFFGFFLIIVLFLNDLSKKQAKNMGFSGIITELDYDGHENPRVKFKNEKFINLLHFSFDNNPKRIIVGDSLYKKKESLILYHFKKNKENKFYLYDEYEY
ncbi:MAG: hypothetical protein COA67_10965 [Lutibacter sp.]|nr:MAG: hypothetical protein COA67_10965 [Lutibacter sp.]